MHKKVFGIWEWRGGRQAQAINEQSKSNITVLSKAEAKEREAKALGKDDNINNLALEKQDESRIIGLRAKIGGEGVIPLHEEPSYLKTIDLFNQNEINEER